MGFSMAYYIATFVVILITHETIFPVKGQCTVQGCDNGDPLSSLVAEIQQLRVDLFDQLNKQVQNIHELLNASFQAVNRRLLEQDVCIKQGRSIHELLNESLQETRSQHGAVTTTLQAVDRRLKEHDMTIKVRTQNLWKLANGSCESESQVWDCSDIKAIGLTANGVYEVCVRHQQNRYWTSVFCDMETANGSSLVFQRRKDGSVNFNRMWAEYKQGFGDRNGEFWLGNDMLHLLTSKRNYKLRVDLEDFHGNKSFAEYTTFSINSSAYNYRLTVGGYSGNAGDSLSNSNGRQFSTIDVDNDGCGGGSCARTNGGAWWHPCCSHATLNGKYYHRYDSVSHYEGIHWYYWHNSMSISLKATTMNLVPVA